jgi:hypothetical protein
MNMHVVIVQSQDAKHNHNYLASLSNLNHSQSVFQPALSYVGSIGNMVALHSCDSLKQPSLAL